MKKITGFLFLFTIPFYFVNPTYALASFTGDCTGGIITHSGGKTIHTFTVDGVLDCTSSGSENVEVLVIGGGGGGGAGSYQRTRGGGGGGGGYQYNSSFPISATSYSVTVGLGGAGGNTYLKGAEGEDSVFSAITAIGGGGGGAWIDGSSAQAGNGGSGGGDGNSQTAVNTYGNGSQGNNGGTSSGAGNTDPTAAGGGGGAGAVGGNSSSGNGGDGGIGISISISGSSIFYAAGGGGGGSSAGGTGGMGGGGNGATGDANGLSGSPNTGGGGGGASHGSGAGDNTGGAGGSGVVIVSYSTPSGPTFVSGSGEINRLVKFTASTTIANALFSDDGINTMLTSGNLYLSTGSILDSLTNGSLNFGVSTSTTMTFGRSGQNMIINSKVGIGTTTPSATLHVVGDIFANFINILAGGLGIDTGTAGLLSLGSTNATSINIGRANATTTISGPLKITNLNTISNCNSTSTPGTCGSAVSGSVAMPTGVSTLVVNTTSVTANSQIFIMEDSSLGSRLGITCNTGTNRNYSINARTAGTSFTIKSSANPTTNKACLSYFIVN